jgi:Holliday junction resolvasome RuvABC endonuclease subunit
MAKKKAIKKPKDFSKYTRTNKKTWFGMDISLTSPAICKFEGDKTYFYFFPQRKKHLDFDYQKNNVYIKALTFYEEILSPAERYDTLSNELMKLFDGYSSNDVGIAIEGFSFASGGNASAKLFQYGGILRHKLFLSGFKDIVEIPPTTAKSYFTGFGHASKEQMLINFRNNKQLDLYEIFDLKETKTGKIPHPIEDIVDAYAITCMVSGKTITHAIIIDDIMKQLKEKTNGR